MSDFFLLNNTVSLYERTTDFDKDSADYIEMKNNLAKLDSELTEKGLLQPEQRKTFNLLQIKVK